MPRTYRLKALKAANVGHSRSIVTDGLVIAGTTAAAYIITFAYEYGYCAYFGVPGFLIEPSTGTVLFAAICIFTASALFIDASFLPRELLAALPWPRLRMRLVLVAVLMVTPFILDRPLNWFTVLIAVLWPLILLFDYLMALICKSGSFSDRISEGEKNAYVEKSAWDGPMKALGVMPVGLMLAALITMQAAWLLGTLHAKFQEGFIVLKAEPDFAVIKRYGDRFVAVKYVGAIPRAAGEFRLVDKEKEMEFKALDKLKIESVRKWKDGERREGN